MLHHTHETSPNARAQKILFSRVPNKSNRSLSRASDGNLAMFPLFWPKNANIHCILIFKFQGKTRIHLLFLKLFAKSPHVLLLWEFHPGTVFTVNINYPLPPPLTFILLQSQKNQFAHFLEKWRREEEHERDGESREHWQNITYITCTFFRSVNSSDLLNRRYDPRSIRKTSPLASTYSCKPKKIWKKSVNATTHKRGTDTDAAFSIASVRASIPRERRHGTLASESMQKKRSRGAKTLPLSCYQRMLITEAVTKLKRQSHSAWRVHELWWIPIPAEY